MQIDTWHRARMNLSAGSPFVSGPVPRNSLSPTTGPDALYSGLLECPLTTRITKDIDSGYDVMAGGNCPHQIQTAAECFSAVGKALGPTLAKGAHHSIVSAPTTQVRGCSVAQNHSSGTLDIVFNTAANQSSSSRVQCGAKASLMAGSAASLVTVRVSNDLRSSTSTITLVGPAAVWYGVGFGLSAMKDSWAVIVEGTGTVSERLLGDHVRGERLSPSIVIQSNEVVGGNRTVVLTRLMRGKHFSFSAAGAVSGMPLSRSIPHQISVRPSGLAARSLDCLWRICPRIVLASQVLPLINAVGAGPTVAYHKAKTAATLVLLPEATVSAAGACVCAKQPLPFGQGKGSFIYAPVKGDQGERGKATKLGFSNRCAPQPRGDLLAQHNPTCDVR